MNYYAPFTMRVPKIWAVDPATGRWTPLDPKTTKNVVFGDQLSPENEELASEVFDWMLQNYNPQPVKKEKDICDIIMEDND